MYFSHHQRGLLSEMTSESAQALEAQRHSLFQEAAAEMTRRDTHNQEVVSHPRIELQHYHRHANSHSDKCQQSQAEFRQNLERSNAEGAQSRNPCEETSTANASFAQKLLVYKLEKRNHPPESRRCEVKTISIRRMLGSMLL